MKFDPTKPFDKVFGMDPDLPGATMQQGPFVYDAKHNCLNPKAAESQLTAVQQAKKTLEAKLLKQLQAAGSELTKAQEEFDDLKTAAAKSKLTKATNKYAKIKAEMSELDV